MTAINISSQEVDHTSISNTFIEYYMTDANGDFVKLYLYLAMLSATHRPITVSDIADHLNCTENDVCRGVKYWIKADALSLSYNDEGEVTGIILLNPKKPSTNINDLKIVDFSLAISQPTAKKEKAKEDSEGDTEEDSEVKVPKKKQPTPKQLSSYQNDPEIANLILEATEYCKHPLSPREINVLIYIKDQLGFSFDLCEYLLEYCAEVKKTSFSYIEKVATNWYEKGIDNRADAEEYSERYITFYSKILKSIGIRNRFPVASEKNYIDKWLDEYGFSENIIIEACNRAISQKPNDVTFPYINGILEKWHDNNVHSFSDISSLDENHSRSRKKASDNPISSPEKSDKLKKLADFYLKEVR